MHRNSQIAFLPILLSSSLLLAIGCGDDDAPDDAGPTADATLRDTSMPDDTSPPDDGGITDGSTVDASQNDGGVADSGAEQDAGADAGPTGTPVWVGVGGWGFRASTRNGTEWDITMNPSTGNDHAPDLLRGVGYGNGVFIAVGGDRNAMVMRSTDGIAWDEDLYPAGRQWKGGVTYGAGRWVAVGGVGTTIYSDDEGLTWTEGPNRLPSAGRHIAYGDSLFVAVGDGGMIATSSDGLTWEDRTGDGSLRFDLAAYANGMWFVGGSQWNGGGFDSDCAVSTDGTTWMDCPFTVGRFEGAMAIPDGLLVGTDAGYRLWDGAEWLESDTDIPSTVYEGDGHWVGVSGDRRMHGPSLDTMERIENAPRGFRDFTRGYVR